MTAKLEEAIARALEPDLWRLQDEAKIDGDLHFIQRFEVFVKASLNKAKAAIAAYEKFKEMGE